MLIWATKTPVLPIGDRIVQKGDPIPDGVLSDETISAYIEKGYIETVIIETIKDAELELEPKPEPEPEPKKKRGRKKKVDK